MVYLSSVFLRNLPSWRWKQHVSPKHVTDCTASPLRVSSKTSAIRIDRHGVVWHERTSDTVRFVLRRLNVDRTFVLEVGVSTASAVCSRLHRSFCTLCHCARAFVCLQLAALNKFIFNIPYYLDVQKQTFTPPDFASDKTATMFWPRKEGAKLFNPLCSHLPVIARIVTFYRGIIQFPVPLFVDERLEIFGTFGVCVCVCTYVLRTYVYMYVCIVH